MKIVIISSKRVWENHHTGHIVTSGGFPFQVGAVSQLFQSTELLVMRENRESAPPGSVRIGGWGMNVTTLENPVGQGIWRKIFFPSWLIRNFGIILSAVKRANAVHVPVPGDIGFVALLTALAYRKPLFIRHCGTWGNRTTLADKFLDWLLPRIAGGRNVVLATGGGDRPPEPGNPNVHWIFSTSIPKAEMDRMPLAETWQPGVPLRLITVGRLTQGKNARAIVEALPAIRQGHPDVHLDILGDGEEKPYLEKRIAALGLDGAVCLHGNVSHEKVLALLSGAHLFIFPTRVKEGFPKALLEAMAVGLPVISADVSVIPHLIRDCGWVLDDTGPEAIARAVLDLAERPAAWEAMAHNARRMASQYTLEDWRDQIKAHLEAAWGPLKGTV